MPDNDGFGRLITYSSVYGRWPTYEDLATCLKPYRVSDVVLTLSWILTTTQSWRAVSGNDRDLSIRRYFAPSLQFHRSATGEEFLFSRASVLWLMRQSFRLCQHDGAPVNTPASYLAIGLAALIGNDLGAYQQPRHLKTNLEFAANLLPLTEYMSLEEFDRDVSRTHYMLTVLAPTAAYAALRGLPAAIERLLGFRLDEYRDLVLASAAKVMLVDSSDPTCCITPALAAQNFSRTALNPTNMHLFWDSVSWDAHEAAEHFRNTASHPWDLTDFRVRPLMRVRSREYVVLDLPFLMDKAGRSLFWTAFGRSEGKERKLMPGYWGELFESYVALVLEQVRTNARQVMVDPRFEDGLQAADCCVLEGRTLIVIEAKASTLTAGVRYADNPDLLRDELERKFVVGDRSGLKGVSQLAHFLHRFAAGDTIRDRNSLVIARRDVDKIIPVLVHLDTALRTVCLNHYMADRLRDMVRIKRPIVTPLALLHISELEAMQGHLDDFLLSDLIESYLSTLRSNPAAMLFAARIPLLVRQKPKRGPILTTFESLMKQTIVRLFPDEELAHLSRARSDLP
ncbi:hypothetical protein [Paludibaculum fermentans]|uniref:hypothetical protein n=1 Tax=Paludibaculum fermentans TaxID=1473598 RepID=UPI003EB994A0